MCRNQLGRRNITDEQKTALIGEAYKAQKSYLRGKQYEAEKMAQGGDRKSEGFSNGQNVHLKSRREIKDGTAGRIGKEYGVNGRTIRRDAEFAKGIDMAEKTAPGIKAAHMAFKAESRGYSPASSFSSMQSRT